MLWGSFGVVHFWSGLGSSWVFKRGTMLSQGDIQLSQILDPHYHAGDVYVAKGHHVLRRVCIPGGPQGYVTIQIPADIRTREQLVRYLVAEHGFRIKDP